MRYIGIFQIMEPRNQLKADFETSITFEPFEVFDAVFTVVLRRMSSIILYMCLYLHWGLFNDKRFKFTTPNTPTKHSHAKPRSIQNVHKKNSCLALEVSNLHTFSRI